MAGSTTSTKRDQARRGGAGVVTTVVLALVAVTLPGLMTPAAAATASTVTAPTTSVAWADSSKPTPLAGASVSSASATEALSVTVSTTRGTLEVPEGSRAGVAVVGDAGWSGATLSLEGVKASMNAALGALRLRGDDTRGSATVTVASGTATASKAVTLASTPGVPTTFTFRQPGTGGAYFIINAPTDDGGSPVLGYTVYATSKLDGSEVSRPASFNANIWGIGGLRGATAYTYKAVAVNALGEGPRTTGNVASTTNATPPEAPEVSYELGERSATVTFKVGYNGGSPVDAYRWRVNGLNWNNFTGSPTQGDTVTVPLPSVLTTGVLHVVEVQGHNFNWGASGVVSFTPVGKPVALTALRATPGNGSADVEFSAPSAGDAAGGTPILGYEYSVDDGKTWAPVAITARANTGLLNGSGGVITGLDNGTTYTVLLRSSNAQGRSPSASVTVTPRTVPGAPVDVVAGPGDRSASVFFAQPTSNGGSAVTGYRYRVNTGAWVTLASADVADGAFDLTNLDNGATYTITMQALNVAGPGASATTTVKPSSFPPPVTALTATPGAGRASIRFSGPRASRLQPIRRYEYSLDGTTWTALPTISNAWTGLLNPQDGEIAGLDNGTDYEVRVRSVNDKGGSEPVSVKVTPRTIPGEVRDLVVGPGDRSATLTFSPPTSTGGSAVTGYRYRVGNGPWQSVDLADEPSFDLTGLVNGATYDVTVQAVNAAGPGESRSVSVVPRSLPGEITSLTAVPGDGATTLTFSGPRASALDPVQRYEYSLDGEHWETLSTTSPAFTGLVIPRRGTVTGLVNGTEQVVRVRAVNVTGGGAEAVVTVTPRTVPAEVRELAAVPGDAGARVSFGAPEDDGGSPVTGYQYRTGGAWKAVDTAQGLAFDLSGLVNGVAATVEVRAVNAAGPGASSTVSITPRTVSSAPRSVVLTPGVQRVGVSLQAPASTGGADVTGYQYSRDGGESWHDVPLTGTGPLTGAITGLDNGTTYSVRVRAVNAAGFSEPSAPQLVTTVDVPGQVGMPTTSTGDGTARVAFAAPAADGGSPVTGYEFSRDGGLTWIATGDGGQERFVELEGLVNGTTYAVSVRAVNAAGEGAARSVSVTPASKPTAAPAGAKVVAGDGAATVSFEAVTADGGSDITGYLVSAKPKNDGDVVTETCATSPCTLTLVNGTAYDVTVAAVNGVGTGPAAEAGSVTPMAPATKPTAAPTALKVVAGDASAVVSFEKVTADGGSEVTGYLVSATPKGGGDVVTKSCATSPCTLELVNGTAYDVTVAAVNEVGAGPAADAGSVTPKAPATKPTAAPAEAKVAAGDGAATVSFEAVTADGGSPVTGYLVSATPKGGGDPVTKTCASSPCTLELVNGTAYDVTVAAVNEVGAGPAADAGSVTPKAPATVPTIPSRAVAEAGDGSAVVTFLPPASDGGSPVTSYVVSAAPMAGGALVGVTCKASPCTIDGLVNGTTYLIQLAALNAVGTGAVGGAGTVTPVGKPTAAPTTASTEGGDGTATISFAEVTADGGAKVTGYLVTATPKNGGAAVAKTCASSPCELALVNGTAYDVAVAAVNKVGAGPAADAGSVTPKAPATKPTTAPGTASSVAGDGTATVAFGAVTADGGSPVTGYVVTATPKNGGAAVTKTCASSPCTLSLANGTTYDLTVAAVNEVGTGPEAGAGSVTPKAPAIVPSSPRSVAATAGDRSATVTFTAPAETGGSPITGYRLSATPASGAPVVSTCSASPCTAAGLVNGTTYTVTVEAVNAVGRSAPSAGVTVKPVAVVVPPGVPGSVSGVGGDRVLTVSWSPSAKGTTPTSSYELSTDGGRTWRRAVTSGTARLTSVVEGVRNGATYPVQVRGVSPSGTGPASSTVNVPLAQWFTDPLAAVRKTLAPVPADPSAYKGPVARTVAAAAAANGDPVMALADLRGRQLQSGQGASMLDDVMFGWASADLTAKGYDQVRSMAASLTYVTAVRCEGYADYGSAAEPGLVSLSAARAKTVCDTLVKYGVKARIVRQGYGSVRPVVIGGRPADRAANRRVIVQATEG